MTNYPGQARRWSRIRVTYPLTSAMLTVPRGRGCVRGLSFFGISFFYIIFGRRRRPVLGPFAGAGIPERRPPPIFA